MTRWAALAWKPALLLLGLAAIGWGIRTVGLDVRAVVAEAGQHGPLAFLTAGALLCAIGMPRQLVAIAGGYAFGFWPGLVLTLAAETVACALDFWWVRLLGRRVAARFLARREGGKLHRLDRFLMQRAFTATLTLRLLPVGNNLVLNLLAGLSGVRATPFLAASALGYIPQTVVFALAGAGASLSDGAQIGLAAVLMAASVALGVVLLRRRPVQA